MRLQSGHPAWVLSAILLLLVTLHQEAFAGVPNACRRTAPNAVTAYLNLAPGHRGTLFVARNGELKLLMKGGVDSCNATPAEVELVRVEGSRQDDMFILSRRLGLEVPGSLGISMFLGFGRDTVRLIGTGDRDSIRVYRFESSSPWIEKYSWKGIAFGNVFGVDLMRLKGRGSSDLLVGKPRDPGIFVQSTRIQLVTKAGRGADTTVGGQRGDRIRGGPGGDSLRGGKGDDVLKGGLGVDLCRGGPGDDSLSGCEV
jgi:RTX calcium-binding nonapeptide repeat (4 copies)